MKKLDPDQLAMVEKTIQSVLFFESDHDHHKSRAYIDHQFALEYSKVLRKELKRINNE